MTSHFRKVCRLGIWDAAGATRPRNGCLVPFLAIHYFLPAAMKKHESITQCDNTLETLQGVAPLPRKHELLDYAQILLPAAGWQRLVLAVLAVVIFSNVSLGHVMPLGKMSGVGATTCPSPPVLSSANVLVTQPTCASSTGFIQVLNAPFNSVAQLTPNAPKPSGGNPYLFSYLVPGTYSLTLTVNGCTSAPLSIVINQAAQVVNSFTLVNADNGTDIQPLTDRMVLNLATLPTQNLNVRANTSSPATIDRVEFRLHGPTSWDQTERVAPYALFGDNGAGDYFGHTLALGRYESLSAQPYAATGCAGTPLAIAFTVINEPATPGNITFTLVNANTGFEFMALTNGATLDLSALPTRLLNIRANTNPTTVGRVGFALSGAQTWNQTERVAPYALFGDDGAGNYFDWTPTAGSYTLTATSYSVGGTAGTPRTIAFTVTDDAARTTSASSAGDPASSARKAVDRMGLTVPVEAYPNPSDGRVSLLLPEALQGEVSYTLVSALGAKVSSGTIQTLAGTNALQLDFSQQMQATGFYMLYLTSGHTQAHFKLLRK